MKNSKSLSSVSKSVVLHRGLMIKQLDESRAAALFSLTKDNRAYLKKWLPWADTPVNQSDTLNFITSAHNAVFEDSRLTFGIFYKEKISGIIGFNSVDLLNGQAEIGYWIGQAFQGLGIVTSACDKLVDIGFNQLALNAISIRCAIENNKSQNVAIRLGFTKIKTILKKENSEVVDMDHIIYMIKRNQWTSYTTYL